MANGQKPIPNPVMAKAEDRVKGLQNQQNPQQTPSPLRRTISTELMKTGFGFIGSAFAEQFEDPNLAVPFQEMGTNIAATLHDRWYKNEYENFQAEHGEAYKSGLSQLMQSYPKKFSEINRGVYTDENGVTQKIDPSSEAAIRLKQNLIREMGMGITNLTNQYMSAAGKYVNNPYVNAETQRLLTQQSAMIGQQFGPTPSDQAEEMTAKTLYYGRLPAESGGGAERKSDRSFADVVAEKGVKNAMNWAISNPTGREFIDPYIDAANSQVEQELVRDNPQLANNVDQLNAAVQKNKRRVQKVAAGRLLEDTLGKDRAQQFFNSPSGDIYAVKPQPVISDNLNKNQIQSVARDAKRKAIDALRTLIENKEVTTYEDAVDEVITLLNLELMQRFSPRTKKSKDAVRSEVINYLNKNKDEIAELIPEVRKLRGFREKGRGVLGATGRTVGRGIGLLGEAAGAIGTGVETMGEEFGRGYKEGR